MALPDFDMRQLLGAGVHFGHQTHRWNPKMGRFIFGSRNNIHILDLAKTVPLLHQALVTVSDVVAKGGRVLFVGTKRQASDAVAKAARESAQYYVNHRWLGGTLTNWKTISHSIKRLRSLEDLLSGEAQGLTKKERMKLTLEKDKLERSLGGIKDMGGVPDLLFIIDTNKESLAVAEAHKLHIPVIGVVDSNSDPDCVTIPIPGNDDAGRAITLYCDLIARAALDGIERSHAHSGIDLGASENPMREPLAEARPSSASKGSSATLAGVSFEVLEAPKGVADDLKKISGIGPVLEQKLNDLGIYHYWQISEFTAEDVTKVDDVLRFKGRVERDDWIGQAKKLLEELEKQAS